MTVEEEAGMDLGGAFSGDRFDLHGKLILRFGRRGKGPGDFELLTGMTVTKTQIIAADYSGKKILIFNHNGTLLEEHRTGHGVESVYRVGNRTWYRISRLNKREKGRKWTRLQILVDLKTRKELLTLTDQSQVHAVHPTRGVLPYPWFPNPFFDRPVFIPGEDARLRIFFCRREDFLVCCENGFKKVTIQYGFQPPKVEDRDKEAFFGQLRLVNRRRTPSRTRDSITFPETMENFHGAMSWEKNIALILLDKIILISRMGHFLETIPLPEEIRKKSRFDGFIFPERFMQFYRNHLYYADQDTDQLMVFELVK